METSLINIFLQSPAIHFVTSLIGVAIFMDLAARDTQKLKAMYYYTGGDEASQRTAIIELFILYLDFINLFIYLLRFSCNRRR